MRKDRLYRVEKELNRYNEAVAALHARVLDDEYALSGSRETGAVRRASLDLSRALADLRKPDSEN
jgi:hypothetical protein